MKRFGLALTLFLGLARFADASVESELNAAKDALRTRDVGKLERIAEKLQGEPLEIYPRYWLMSAQLDSLSDAQARQFLQTYPGSLLADRFRGEWLKTVGKSQRWDVFGAEFPALVNSDPELDCYQLRARLARQDNEALKDARNLWFTGKDMPESCGPLFDTLRANESITPDDIWSRVRLGLENNNLGLVKRLMQYVPKSEAMPLKDLDAIANNPLPALKRNKWVLQGRGAKELAIFAIHRFARTEPALAAEYWRRLEAQFNESQRGYAWAQIGMYGSRHHLSPALFWYKEAGSTPLSDQQLEWKVRAALREQNWPLVQTTIEAMANAQQSDAPWRYWRGRALKAQNKVVEANEIFAPLSREHHFYGLLAREELGTMIDTSGGRYKPSDTEIKAALQLPGLQRALALYKMDWRNEANKEWNWSMRGLDDTQLLAAAELAARNRWYDRAIYSADKTVSVHDFNLRYVAPYRDVVQDYAKQVNLDDAWVFGLMRQESRFVSVAHSGVGASGLMQLMPETARWVARKLGLKKFRTEMVNEIGTNVQLGTFYLKHVLNSLGGQPVLATAAYNAGPGRARAWQGDQALEGAIYIESIPFTETRDYCKKVMANAFHYARTFDHDPLPLKQRIGVIAAK